MAEEVQTEGNDFIENGQHIELVNDMREMLNNLEPPLSTDCCIYRVPYHLRELSEESYTPKVVSVVVLFTTATEDCKPWKRKN